MEIVVWRVVLGVFFFFFLVYSLHVSSQHLLFLFCRDSGACGVFRVEG